MPGDYRTEGRLPSGHAYRPLVAVAVALAAGIACREYGLGSPALVGSLLAAALVAWPLARLRSRPRLGLLALYLLFAASGWMRLHLAKTPPPPHHLAYLVPPQPQLVKVRARVASDPVTHTSPPMPLSGESDWLTRPERKARCQVDVEALLVGATWRPISGRVRLVLYHPTGRLRYGDRVTATGILSALAGPTGPGQFDHAQRLRRKGICGNLVAEEAAVAIEQRGQGHRALALACAARRLHRELLEATVGRSDPQAAAMLRATVLGDRAELDEELEDAFQHSGTMHLLAISGLHVGVVALLVWKLTSLLCLGQRTSGVLVLVTVALYAVATGLTPSVARAAIVTAFLVGALIGRRRLDPLQATAAAAIVLLLARPTDLFGAGFQLSFAAVVCISCLYADFRAAWHHPARLAVRLLDEQHLGPGRRAFRWLRGAFASALAVSLAAWLGVFPLIAHYFHVVSPITVVANVLAVPLLGLVVALGFLHLGLGLVWAPLAALPGLLAQGATACLACVVRGAARLPLAWTYCSAPGAAWLLAYYALGVAVLARRRLGLSDRRAAALWLAGLSAYFLATAAPVRPDGLALTVFDVRHGSATVLRYPDGATVAYDCGTYGRVDVGRHVAAPALWHWRVRRIDLLAISHADIDHINGIPSLIERFAIGRAVYSPVLARTEAGRQLLALLDRHGIPHGPARAGDRIRVRGHPLDVLAPTDWLLRARPDNQNDNSLVLRAEHDGSCVLLTGDIQNDGALVLMHSAPDLRAAVLLVPHHGCRMPQTERFADAVQPAFAIMSNRAERLPPDTLAAYEAVGARVLTTCRDDAVTATLKAGEARVETHVKAQDSARPRARR
ncbi:DNA internalization-related competence protein ComEC/Rec2 [bacterium]|nr:DNA internalization-related competence protein ComEC/Rec2 [bacterium]